MSTDVLRQRMTDVLKTAVHAGGCGAPAGRFEWPGPHAESPAWWEMGKGVWMTGTSCGCGARVYAVAPEPNDAAVTHVFAADRYMSLEKAFARAVQ